LDGKITEVEPQWDGRMAREVGGELEIVCWARGCRGIVVGHILRCALFADMALIWDKKLKPFVKEYANDDETFAKDFTAAFVKLLELGVPFENPGQPAPSTPKSSA
jgi:hypothetical protein